ncbi:MAG: DUF2877 domain-containing protein [Acidimicrobiia bacterium]|nr:DUF2877 domain-containing protein [Acidimicrobiia bacterium]
MSVTTDVAFLETADGTLVAVHAPDVECFPFSLLVEREVRALGLAVGDRVTVGSDALEIGGERIVTTAVRPEPRAHSISPMSVAAVAALLDECGPYVPCEPVVRGSEQFLASLVHADGNRVDRAILDLVGLGPGLTPSGDDLLLGFLALEHRVGSTWTGHGPGELADRIRALSPGRTTRVSRALFDAAARDRFCPSVERLCRAVLQGDPVEGRAATQALLEIGAHSGRDTLAGMRAYCELARRRESRSLRRRRDRPSERTARHRTRGSERG